MKRKLKIKNVIIFILMLIVITIGILIGIYFYNLTPVNSNSNEEIEVVIPSGSSKKTISKILKNKQLIRNDTIFMIYVKLNKINNLKASTYKLKKSMSLEKIVKTLEEGNSYNPDEVKITFKEGINMRKLAKIIEEKTNNKYNDVFLKLQDKSYIKSLIDKYWFLSDKILNKDIYYSLEGFLFPDTYIYKNKEVKVEEIFKSMLDGMDKELTKYKEKINSSKKDVFDIITMASIIESETSKDNQRKEISSVFYNRLSISMKLESCATLYYGSKKEFTDIGIANSEMIRNNNPYNTYMYSGLPVGPISLPSRESIEASINPAKTDYLYFLSDNVGNTYFFKTYKEHQAKQKKLEQAGLWLR